MADIYVLGSGQVASVLFASTESAEAAAASAVEAEAAVVEAETAQGLAEDAQEAAELARDDAEEAADAGQFIEFSHPGWIGPSESMFGGAAFISTARVWRAGLPGLLMAALVPATAQVVVDIRRNGVSIGTLTWAIAGTVPTVVFAADVTWAVGDTRAFVGPATSDATLAYINGTLPWFRVGQE